MRVWLIDDEEYMRALVLPRAVLARWPDARMDSFDSLATAMYSNASSVDLIIIDITSVCPVSKAQTAYGPICQLLDQHPGVTLIINSALPTYAVEGVRDSVLTYNPDAKLLVSTFPVEVNLPKVLAQVV